MLLSADFACDPGYEEENDDANLREHQSGVVYRTELRRIEVKPRGMNLKHPVPCDQA